MQRIAIQGERGSNSHMAARAMFSRTGTSGVDVEIVSCSLSPEVFAQIESRTVDAAVLPIENSLHGSVAEHYDLLLQHPVQVTGESLARIRHNVIAAPGVQLSEIRRVMSHPVALSQCRRWLADQVKATGIEVVPFYDTAGSVKHLMSEGMRDVAGIAPELAAEEYGAQILVPDVEDHVQNYTRFYLLESEAALAVAEPNKMSVAFSLKHQPGSLMSALERFRTAGLNLTRIESRPVPGKPWEYVFYVDVRFDDVNQVEDALEGLRRHCEMVKELGRYRAAEQIRS